MCSARSAASGPMRSMVSLRTSRIALSGVRSSWLMRDRNSLFAALARSASRLASSAAAAAARSSACSRALISATPVCWASDCSTNRSPAGGRPPRRLPGSRRARLSSASGMPRPSPVVLAGYLAPWGGAPAARPDQLPADAGQLDADEPAARQRGDGGTGQLDDPSRLAAVAHELGQREQALQAGQLCPEAPEFLGHRRGGQLFRRRRNSSGWM